MERLAGGEKDKRRSCQTMSSDDRNVLSPFTHDRLRFIAMRVWSSTMERTYDIDLDIIELAAQEAQRRYLERIESPVVLSFIEETETIEAWATWHALACQVARRQRDPIGAFYTVVQDLEKALERLTIHTCEDML
jgi:hypothetical protein